MLIDVHYGYLVFLLYFNRNNFFLEPTLINSSYGPLVAEQGKFVLLSPTNAVSLQGLPNQSKRTYTK
jgi:hypothetical protein